MSATIRRTRNLLVLGFFLGITALLFVAVAARASANQFVRTADEVARRQRVLDAAADARKALTRAESEQRGFVLTGQPEYLVSFDETPEALRRAFDRMRSELGGPDQDLDTAQTLAGQKVAEMQRTLRAYQQHGENAARDVIRTNKGLHLMTGFRSAILLVETRQRQAMERASRATVENRNRIERSTMFGLSFAAAIVLAAMAVVLRDLRRRRTAEERLAENLALQNLIFDSVAAAIIATDEQGRVTLFNAAAQKMLGYTAEEALGSMAVLQKIHDPGEVEEASRELSAEFGQPVPPSEVFTFNSRRGLRFVREWNLVRKDGSRVPVLLSLSTLRSDTNSSMGMVGIATDLTQQKAAREQLDRYVDDLEMANQRLEESAIELKESRDVALAATRTKSEFLANMSHEIRTPMNGVLGMAHLLQSTALNDRQRGFVRTIIASAESLLTILNDILDLSKMEAGKMTLEHFPFDLRTLLEDICEAQAPVAHAKALEMTCIYPPGAPEYVLGDPGRLRQVVMNLVSNAVKFTQAGEVTIVVEVLRESPNHVAYRIAVRDTGIGIPKDRQEGIFESFTQADGSTTREFGGTGLGLTISRQLVTLMGGDMGVVSQPGEGSEFWIEIPLQRQDLPEDGAMSRPDLNGRRILIADDNATNRTVLREHLTHWKAQVVEAASGREVLERAREDGPFDCVVLDFHMPELDGLATAQALRREPSTSRLPLILLSSSGFSADEAEATTLFDSVLFKPVRSGPLYNSIAHATGSAVTLLSIAEDLDSIREDPRLAGLRVLIVEDNPVNQMVASEYLETWGCQYETADNGAAAVTLYRERSFDIILMDVQMPVMDGFEATAEIRRLEELDGGHVPILAMTANAMSGDRERCLRAGMDGYLSKPLQPRVLKERLLELAREVTSETKPMTDSTAGGAPLFDPQRLDETCAGKASLKLRVIERYIATAGASVDAIEAAVQSGDAGALASAAHALKGSSLTIGSPLLSALCEQVEHAAREGNVDRGAAEQIRPSLERLKASLEELAQQLRSNV